MVRDWFSRTQPLQMVLAHASLPCGLAAELDGVPLLSCQPRLNSMGSRLARKATTRSRTKSNNALTDVCDMTRAGRLFDPPRCASPKSPAPYGCHASRSAAAAAARWHDAALTPGEVGPRLLPSLALYLGGLRLFCLLRLLGLALLALRLIPLFLCLVFAKECKPDPQRLLSIYVPLP